MIQIAIDGPSGAGKSYLSQLLRKKNIPVIDADDTYHSLLIPPSRCLDAIREAFGDGVFREDGSLDRTALSAVVFGSEEKLDLLNATVLGYVLDRVREILSEYEAEGRTVAAVDAPTLIESGFYTECHTVVSVLADKGIRVARIMARDGISESAARARVDAQKEDSFYIERSHIVLDNNGDEATFAEKCEGLYSLIDDNSRNEKSE